MTAPQGRTKSIFIGNAHLARQELRAYDPASNAYKVWIGPAQVALCAVSVDPTTNIVTYTPIGGLGPFAMTSAVPGVFYFEFTTAQLAALNAQQYLNALVYQVVIAGPNNELQDVQPLLVCPSRFTS